tara:strand:- start:25 stop:834 length:810 start_codon:yes stop_codon:yes gene_type:complete
MDSFKIQSPEWYDSIYSNKSYKKESLYYLNIFRKLNSNKKIIALDIGTGTGKLIPYFIDDVYKFIGIEPYNLFFNFTNKKFINKKNLTLKNLRFEDYLKEIDNDINLTIANFNVFNYLEFNHLKNQLKILSDKLSKDSILIFDTWSLDYVNLQPFKSGNINLINNLKNPDKNAILRFAESEYFKNESKIEINFDFISVSKNSFKKIGKEKHNIYPFNIKQLISDLREIKWELIFVDQASNIVKSKNTLKSNIKQYSDERNYFLSFILKK